MPQAFLASSAPDTEIQAAIAPETPSQPTREKVKILAIGSNYAVDRVVHELYRIGFAEVREWSQPLPTGTAGEVMRILTRYVFSPDQDSHRSDS